MFVVWKLATFDGTSDAIYFILVIFSNYFIIPHFFTILYLSFYITPLTFHHSDSFV